MRSAVLAFLVWGCGDNLHPSNGVDAPSNAIDAAIDGPPCVPATLHPMVDSVMTGTLAIDALSTISSLPLGVPFDRSVLFVSVSENEPSPDFGAVMCELLVADVGLGTPTGLVCRRNDAGTDNPSSTGIINVRYTIATFSSGVTVQRGHVNTGFTNPSDVTLTAIDPTSSFVLIGGMLTGGGGWGNNEFVRATLQDDHTLDIRTNVMGSQVTWQVVTMDGAVVQRGSMALAATDLQSSASVAPITPGSLALMTYSIDNTSSIAASELLARATLVPPSSLHLERTAVGPTIDASWEVVTLPVATQQFVTAFAPNELTKTQAVTNLSTNSVAISTMQAVLGESTGSTDYAGTLLDLLGEGSVTLATSPGSVAFERATASASASISWNAIDFGRDRCAN